MITYIILGTVCVLAFILYIDWLHVRFIVSYFRNKAEYNRRYWGKNKIDIVWIIIKTIIINVMYGMFVASLLRAM